MAAAFSSKFVKLASLFTITEQPSLYSAALEKFPGLVIDNFYDSCFRDCIDNQRIISKMLTDACFKFALECLKKCMLMEPKHNIFLSPHLLYQNLLVIYFGAIDDTENSLRKILCIPDDLSKAVIQQYYFFGGVNQFCYIITEKSFTCQIFSRFLINESNVLYLNTINLFSSGHQVKEVDFDHRPDHTWSFVDNSVICMSRNHIQKILPPNSFDSNTDAILLNVIYCNGQFDRSRDLDIKPDIDMRKKTDGKHCKYEQLDAYIMELPFKEKKISAFFIYPSSHLESAKDNFSERDRINQLLERLTTEEGSRELHKLLDEGLTQETDMLCPTFDIEQDLEMYQLLDMLGLQEFTPPGTGRLHEFTCNTIKLGSAVHRISIKMTMTSLTATATSIFFTNNSCEEYTKIHATMTNVDPHFPCICLIYDKVHRNILFCGVLLES